ncbi:uncharacterized protein LOC129914478 [Episyrphus balteatus]|uniref:uncharacterized protein LOC129914478 n=1 Tax=Episyrphus balteatus TaxID=286459 RepID=UPI002485BD94|nr:uncharacterized protein LOC129914478 [Episyrphus balteatus]
MDNPTENEITCYKIIHNDHLPSSQELFEIENSTISAEQSFPIHEEYKLPIARSQFVSDTKTFTDEILEDLRKSRMRARHISEKKKLFLKQSQLLLGNLKKRRKAFNERSNKFIVEARRHLLMLNEECEMIAEEAYEVTIDLNEILDSMRK